MQREFIYLYRNRKTLWWRTWLGRNSTVSSFRNESEASSRNHRLINLEGRQGDKRGPTNCRYRTGAIFHEHLSPKEVLGCASRRKVERRDLEDEARYLLGISSSFSLFLSLFWERHREGGRGKDGERKREGEPGLVSKRYISGLASQWRIVCIEATIGERGATLINEPINNSNVSTENSAG